MGRNVGLRGRVVDERGDPHVGLFVSAVDVDLVGADDPLGWTRTDASGEYDLAYPPAKYGLLEKRPDLQVTVWDRWGIRPVARTPTERHVADAFHRMPTLTVPRAETEGWLATLGTGAPARLTTGNAVDVLVDGEETFTLLLAAVRGARRSLHLMQLLFKPNFPAAYRDTRGGPAPVLLADAFVEAAKRDVDVRVLLNENAVVPDDVDEMRRLFARRAGEPPRIRGFLMSPAVMHAKALVVDDDEAYVLGQPFQKRFWDTREHRFDDPRRGDALPRHDVSLRLRGPAVAQCAEVFARLWNARPSQDAAADAVVPPPPPPPGGDQAMQVLLTAPEGDLPGETGILESYLRALAESERFVYLETQYFTSRTMARAIRRALDMKPDLRVILALNESMDIPGYNQQQALRLREVGWPGHPRLGVYSMWRAGTREGRLGLRGVYVHSKVAVADDKWATVGSANLDGISLDRADELGLDARSVDMNVVLPDGLHGLPGTGVARRLRCALWSEWLGLAPEDLVEEPPGGWLHVWDRAAQENLDALRDGLTTWPRGFVLRHNERVPDGVLVFERGLEFLGDL